MLKRIFCGVLVVIFVFIMATGTWAFDAKKLTIFWLNKQYEPKLNLKTLKPLSDGLRAILALYAMRANTGCDVDVKEENVLHCNLTTALALGKQCSKKQLDLVGTWFKNGIPPINISQRDIDEAFRSGNLRWLCNDVPDTATHRSMWEIIRVELQEDLVKVYAMGSWTEGPSAAHGKFRYETVYRISADFVDVVSHKELPVGRKGH